MPRRSSSSATSAAVHTPAMLVAAPSRAASRSRSPRGGAGGGAGSATPAAGTPGARGDSLQQYLNDVGAENLLDAREEIVIAKELELLELDHWRQLLSYAPAFETVALAVEANLPSIPKELEALRRLMLSKRALGAAGEKRRASAVDALVVQLRELDLDRSARIGAELAVFEEFGPRRSAARYLERVQRARAAEQRTKNRFVAANLRLVVAIARRYRTELMPFADVVQEGNLGLIRAVERFDHRRGFRFSTYAAWWIRHGVSRALADKARVVRVPVHALDDARRILRTRREHVARTGEQPTVEAIAAETGMPVEKVASLIESSFGATPFSLDAAVRDDGETTWLETMPSSSEPSPEDSLESTHWQENLDRAMHVLSPFESTILRYRFGLGGEDELTLREIGSKYNLSRERIRQIQEQALLKLRGAIQDGRGSLEGEDGATYAA